MIVYGKSDYGFYITTEPRIFYDGWREHAVEYKGYKNKELPSFERLATPGDPIIFPRVKTFANRLYMRMFETSYGTAEDLLEIEFDRMTEELVTKGLLEKKI